MSRLQNLVTRTVASAMVCTTTSLISSASRCRCACNHVRSERLSSFWYVSRLIYFIFSGLWNCISQFTPGKVFSSWNEGTRNFPVQMHLLILRVWVYSAPPAVCIEFHCSSSNTFINNFKMKKSGDFIIWEAQMSMYYFIAIHLIWYPRQQHGWKAVIWWKGDSGTTDFMMK